MLVVQISSIWKRWLFSEPSIMAPETIKPKQKGISLKSSGEKHYITAMKARPLKKVHFCSSSRKAKNLSTDIH
jgi:hypothetical protein